MEVSTHYRESCFIYSRPDALAGKALACVIEEGINVQSRAIISEFVLERVRRFILFLVLLASDVGVLPWYYMPSYFIKYQRL